MRQPAQTVTVAATNALDSITPAIPLCARCCAAFSRPLGVMLGYLRGNLSQIVGDVTTAVIDATKDVAEVEGAGSPPSHGSPPATNGALSGGSSPRALDDVADSGAKMRHSDVGREEVRGDRVACRQLLMW